MPCCVWFYRVFVYKNIPIGNEEVADSTSADGTTLQAHIRKAQGTQLY